MVIIYTIYLCIFFSIKNSYLKFTKDYLECSPNGPGDLGSIPGRVIPKTLKMVHDTSLINTQQNNVLIEGKVEQSKEKSRSLPYTLV